ncbi:MAG: hypothetical protein PHN69_07175 [Candidatus Pacebacteria bacterium]|jgi:hypothetical protein|nr:hypothetical protein [Candidatus Paceibacterota bacterium]
MIKKIINKLVTTFRQLLNHIYRDEEEVGNKHTILDKVFGHKPLEMLLTLIAYIGLTVLTFFTFQFLVLIYKVGILTWGSMAAFKVALPTLLYLGFWMLVSFVGALFCYDITVSIIGEMAVRISKVIVITIAIIVLGNSEIAKSPFVRKIFDELGLPLPGLAE